MRRGAILQVRTNGMDAREIEFVSRNVRYPEAIRVPLGSG